METRQALRPLASLAHATPSSPLTTPLHFTRSPAAALISATSSNGHGHGHGRRHQSTTSRTKKMLKIPPHPDFLTPNAGQNHIIFNPPASAPSVYHTPFKFLPKTDPRRRANLSQLFRTSEDVEAGSKGDGSTLPPPSRESETRQRKYNVTEEQVEEMRRLRAEDPVQWSVLKLAAKFDCTPMFVMICCRPSDEHHAKERQRLQAIKARWGPRRTKAREDRFKRRTLLLQGLI
jgi:hypothetical protein